MGVGGRWSLDLLLSQFKEKIPQHDTQEKSKVEANPLGLTPSIFWDSSMLLDSAMRNLNVAKVGEDLFGKSGPTNGAKAASRTPSLETGKP